MPISRRNLIRSLGASAVVGAAAPSLGRFPLAVAAQASAAVPTLEPILLYRNENAYGPSEKVLAAMREGCVSSNRYPRTEYDSLVNKIAALHAVKTEQVVLGCGSGEILHMAGVAFLGPGKKLAQASPTFPALREFAQSAGFEVIDVPLNKMYEHDLEAMLSLASASAGLVYICNPNNPTGTLTPRNDIETFIRKLPAKTMVLIDEAYHHYVGQNSTYLSFLDQRFDDPRVIVARTFSKIYGLAGMRTGCCSPALHGAYAMGRERGFGEGRGRGARRFRVHALGREAKHQRPPGVHEPAQRAHAPRPGFAHQLCNGESDAPAR
jgi:histidinol-phosphate aminotransferase